MLSKTHLNVSSTKFTSNPSIISNHGTILEFEENTNSKTAQDSGLL